MSVRIDNGYKIVGFSGIKELFEFFDKAAAGIRRIQKEEVLKLMGLYLSMEFDLAAAARRDLVTNDARPLRIDDEKGSVISQVMSKVAERVYRASRSEVRDNEFDMGVSLSIFRPQPHSEGQFFPAMLFAARQAFFRQWQTNEEVIEFGYNSIEEAPDGISESEWEYRKVTWHQILPHGKPPIECSMSFQLSEVMLPFSLSEQMGSILSNVPDYDLRLRNLARLIASHEKSEEILGDREIEEFPLPERIRMSREIALWLHENMDQVVEEKSPVIKEFLVREITLDRVLHPMNQAL